MGIPSQVLWRYISLVNIPERRLHGKLSRKSKNMTWLEML